MAGGLLAAGLVAALLFGRRWQQSVLLQAFASPDDGKVAWAKGRLGRLADKGVGLLLGQLGRRGEHFDLRVADYLEEVGQADRLPHQVRIRAALAQLTDPVLAPVGFTRLLELPPEAWDSLLEESVGLEGGALHASARAAAKLDPKRCAERARELLRESAPAKRRLGLALLGGLGGEENASLLLPHLSDADAGVRAEAVHDLALVQGRGALGSLAPLLGDPDERVRGSVLTAIINTGQAEDAQLLLPALQDESEGLRAQAVLGLARVGPQGHAESLLPLARDGSARVRGATATALAVLPGEQALEMLLGLAQDGSAEVRQAATDSLGRRSEDDRAFAALRERAEDASLEVVRVAYLRLVDSRRPEVLPFFIGALADERPSWAVDPLPPDIAGARPKPVPRAALANCALRWLTGQDFGYHWRASRVEREGAQKRWQEWYAHEGKDLDLRSMMPPKGLATYEDLLGRAPRPSAGDSKVEIRPTERSEFFLLLRPGPDQDVVARQRRARR
jgi:HEAT repeat protein